jgi:CBS domain-containing protein
LGVVTAEDFADIPHLEKNHVDAIQDVQVAELMSKEVVSVEPDTTLYEAAGTMLEGGFRHLPVLDAHRRLVGILSERDVRTFLGVELGEFHRASRGSDEHVSSLMRQNPTTLLPTSSLVSAIEVFSDERVGALPVMNEDDTLAGMLSYVDVMTWLSGESARVPAVSAEVDALLPP